MILRWFENTDDPRAVWLVLVIAGFAAVVGMAVLVALPDEETPAPTTTTSTTVEVTCTPDGKACTIPAIYEGP